MKNIIILLILIVSFTSCEKFLEEVPKDRISEVTFYQTLSDAKAAVNAIYGPIQGRLLYGEQYLLQLEIPADYAYGRGSTMPIGGEYTGLDATNMGRVAKVWMEFYRAINYSNIALEKISEMDIEESEITSLVAEAKFLRAFCYYNLVRDFGAVPLILSSQDGDMPRETVDKVYEAIIADLQVAENDLPDSPVQYGHPSKWTASTMLSEVYLTMGNWSVSRDKAKEIIDSDQFALVEIEQLADWNNLFGGSVNGTQEEIFYIKYNYQTGGNAWPFYLSWKNSTMNPFGAYVLYSDPENPFIQNWDDQDLRKQWDVFTTYTNIATGETDTLVFPPMCYGKFRDPNAPAARSYGNDFPIWRYADVLLIYAEATAMAENGPSAFAIECLNTVKRRGYGYPSQTVSPVDYPETGWTAETFREAVLQERAYEFISEGKRWKDLKRSGMAKEVILAHLGKTVADKFMLWPVPQQEIETNPAINQEHQNPGY